MIVTLDTSTMLISYARSHIDPLVVSWIGTAVAVGYAVYVTYNGLQCSKKNSGDANKGLVNLDVDKQHAKVVHTFEIEDLGAKTVLCRCWKSKCFPKCDGSHVKHNKDTGDNVGPVIIQKSTHLE